MFHYSFVTDLLRITKGSKNYNQFVSLIEPTVLIIKQGADIDKIYKVTKKITTDMLRNFITVRTILMILVHYYRS